MDTIDHPDFEAVIGLEVHAQLTTRTKAFAPVRYEYGEAPNTQVTPLCLGHPGTLPTLNQNLVRHTIRMGLATGCDIAPRSIFARKNYFYPDLPKGYQISQYETPLCSGGHVEIELPGYTKRIGVTRIHMEEDSGKSIHDQDPVHSLIDLNRAGASLIEIVSEPDLRTPEEAYAYLNRIRQIVQYLEICDGNMEEGSLRCDANVSVRPRGQEAFGTRTELKNMNSFRNVERAIRYEIQRQIELVQAGGRVVQQTLLWDPSRNETRMMRGKEEAHDYRYFPEPDLPPVLVTQALLQEVRAELPEMPDLRRRRFRADYGHSEDDAVTLTENRHLADFFEEVVTASGNPRAATSLVLSQVLRVLNERGTGIGEFPVTPQRLSGLIALREADSVNSTAFQQIFNEMLESGESAEEVARRLNLMQVNDDAFLVPIVERVLASHPEEAARFREGKTALIGFFVGKVMQASGGKANPKQARELLLNALS